MVERVLEVKQVYAWYEESQGEGSMYTAPLNKRLISHTS